MQKLIASAVGLNFTIAYEKKPPTIEDELLKNKIFMKQFTYNKVKNLLQKNNYFVGVLGSTEQTLMKCFFHIKEYENKLRAQCVCTSFNFTHMCTLCNLDSHELSHFSYYVPMIIKKKTNINLTSFTEKTAEPYISLKNLLIHA